MELKIGDIVEMKKQHPCGSKLFAILRTGADIKLQCKGCGRIIMSARADIMKYIKKIAEPAAEQKN
jgi:hypothetical protein